MKKATVAKTTAKKATGKALAKQPQKAGHTPKSAVQGKKVLATPTTPEPVKKSKRELDEFGYTKGCKASQAMQMLKDGKNSMADVAKKLGQTFYNALHAVEKRGFETYKDEKGMYHISKLKT